MLTVPSGSPSAATPTDALDPIVTLLSALPLGSWMWVAVAIAVLALGAYAAHRTASALTPADVEPLGARQARELAEGAQR